MKIDWAALGIVSIVALVSTLVVVGITAAGIAAIDAAQEREKVALASGAAATTGSLRAVGYFCFGLAGAAVLYGIYLIVPAFH